MNTRVMKPCIAALTASVLCACGGGGSSDDGVGTLNVAVTDAPVDGVTEVWVEFYGYTLKPSDDTAAECVEVPPTDEVTVDNDSLCEVDSGQIVYTFDEPRKINLKELTDGKVEFLFREDVPAGRYNWMKLHVNADFNEELDSYVVEDGGGHAELRIPPDRLKLGNHFTVNSTGVSSFVIEWNLRMGLTNPVGQPGYKLQPSLRITDMTDNGTIAGLVDPGLLQPINTSCTSDVNTGDGNVVYVYEGTDIVPDDINGIAPDPITTADVKLNLESGNYEYMVPFLSPGNYTVAFTCQGADDVVPDPEQPQLAVEDDIEFTEGKNAPVTNGATTIVNFEALTPPP